MGPVVFNREGSTEQAKCEIFPPAYNSASVKKSIYNNKQVIRFEPPA